MTRTVPKKIDETKLARQVVSSILTSLVVQGRLTQKDLGNEEVVRKTLLSLTGPSTKMQLVVDHTDSLVRKGDDCLSKGQHDDARLFYATFFEHIVNSIIVIAIDRKNVSEKVRLDILRSVSLSGKLTWLLELLDLSSFNPIHRKVILSLAEKRNAYVHYKYLPDPDDDKRFEDSDRRLKEEMTAIRRAISYAKRYESLLKYGKGKQAVTKKIRDLTQRSRRTGRKQSAADI